MRKPLIHRHINNNSGQILAYLTGIARLKRSLSDLLSRVYLFASHEVFVQLSIFIILTLLSIFYFISITSIQLDDSYIYFRIVENFYNTGELSFNPGEPRNLMTSSGWFLILLASKFVFPDTSIVLTARIWSIVLLVASSILLFRILRNRLPRIGMLSPLPVFFMPSIPGLAGHETALALFMNLFLIWAFLERRPILFPVAAVGAYLARGEAAIFAMILGLAYLCADGFTNKNILAKARELAAGIAIALAIFLLWHGYHYHLTGSILPATFSAKAMQTASGHWPLFALKIGTHLKFLSGALAPWVHALALFGLWIVWRRAWPLALWPMAHYLTLTALGMPWYHWYYYPIEFSLIIGFIAAGDFIARIIGQHAPVMSRSLPQTALVLAVCIFAVVPLRNGAAGFPTAVSNPVSWTQAKGRPARPGSRFATYNEIADWITANHNNSRAPVVLVNEIGIIGYLLPDARVYDVVGLASPVKTPADIGNFATFVARYIPDFVIRTYNREPPKEIVFQLQTDKTVRYVAGVIKHQTHPNVILAVYQKDGHR